jgi:hypothetical protein
MMKLLMTQFLHVTRADYVSGYQVRLEFNNGDSGIVDLQNELSGPVFEPLRDTEVFARFRIEGHTLSWDNGADFAPEFLHSLLRS